MQKTKIEWCDYTWNPVVGCKHDCWYCYARKLCNRFKMIPDWTDPVFYPDRLHDPLCQIKPGNIFVCSMADLFGEWVPATWINQIIEITKMATEHEFMFLTKNPGRYREFNFPGNCWLGATMTNPEDCGVIKKNNPECKTFISIEPISGSFKYSVFAVDLVIVGAMTGPAALVPKKEWIESIVHPNILYKDNIKKYL